MVSVWVIVLVSISVASLSHALFGGKVDKFFAEQVMIDPSGNVVNTSKLYVTPDAVRIDGMPGASGPGTPKADISMLIFVKQKKQYIYNNDGDGHGFWGIDRRPACRG